MTDYIKTYEELRDSLSVIVKIDHIQVKKVVVKDLICKRNHCVQFRKGDGVEHYDYILKGYLGEKDFQKYVIEKAEIVP